MLEKKENALFLGIDGGGTKTAFALISYDGRVVEYFTRGGSNPNDVGTQAALDVFIGGIEDARQKYPSVAAAFCGIAGSATGGNIEYFTSCLSDKFPDMKFAVNSDFENIFALEDNSDIAIISGTGSVVCVRKDNGYAMLGGWGHLLDKAGSAYDIGREAVFCALEEEELNKPHSLITELLCEKLNVSKVRSAVASLYREGKPYIASLAGVVFAAYQRGDARAAEIIDETAKRLAELLNSAVEQYAVSPCAVSGGGMFEHYGEIMVKHIAKYTDVQIVLPKCPPIYGACKRSRRLVDSSLHADFEENFIKSFKAVKEQK